MRMLCATHLEVAEELLGQVVFADILCAQAAEERVQRVVYLCVQGGRREQEKDRVSERGRERVQQVVYLYTYEILRALARVSYLLKRFCAPHRLLWLPPFPARPPASFCPPLPLHAYPCPCVCVYGGGELDGLRTSVRKEEDEEADGRAI